MVEALRHLENLDKNHLLGIIASLGKRDGRTEGERQYYLGEILPAADRYSRLFRERRGSQAYKGTLILALKRWDLKIGTPER